MKVITCAIDSLNVKQYDRETLLGLRDSSAARSRPINLPDLPDIILKTPVLGNGMGLLGSGGPPPMNVSGPMMAGGMGDKGISCDWRNGNDPFSPGYVKSARPSGNLTKRGSQQGKKEVKNIMIHIPKDVKLRTCDNAWVPIRRGNQTQEEEDLDWVLKRVRSILNKLTPENFNTLQTQMETITIDTEEKLAGVTSLVFEKAILEPNFGEAYSKFCKFLLMLRVPSSTNPDQIVNFRSLLITTCQKEFEKDSENEQKILDKRALLKKAESEEDKKKMLEDLEEEMAMARHRSVGNIKFIGELFKNDMLTEKIMHECLCKLSCSTDVERLECFCSLLSSIGQILDKSDQVDQYFRNVQKLITDKKVSSRIRFMIMDLIDLRRRNWIPRHSNKGPKTLDELHQDIVNEEIENRIKIDAAASQLTSSLAGQRNRGGRAGSMGPPAPPQAHDSDGWNTVSTRPMRTAIDPKMWLPKPCKIDDNVQLTPCVGPNKFSPWARGSTGGGGRGSRSGEPQQNTDRPSAPANRFSALCGDEDEATTPTINVRGGQENRPEMYGRGGMRRDGGRSGGNLGGQQSGRGQFNSSRGKTISRRFSQEDRNNQKRGSNDNLTPLRGQNREEGRSRRIRSRENSRNRNLHTPMGSRENSANRQSVLHSRENSRDATMYSRENGLQDSKMGSSDTKKSAATERSTPSGKPPSSQSGKERQKPMTDEELEKRMVAIIDEYLNIKDLKEAILCVSELKSLRNSHVAVSTGISHVLDMTDQSRKMTGNLFYTLIAEKVLPHTVYVMGLKSVMKHADDLEIDIPKIWIYLAELISPVLEEKGLPWNYLTEVVKTEVEEPSEEPLEESRMGCNFIAALLTKLVGTMGEEKVIEFWSAANLKLSDFTEIDAAKFVAEHEKLKFLFDAETSSAESKLNSLQAKLHSLLQDPNCKNEAILDLIDSEISEEQTKTGEFIRILMTEICSNAIDGNAKVKSNTINNRCVVLVKFLDHQLDLQLHALYALQALDLKMEHPPNVLRIMFEILYDEEVISENAYFSWEKSADSAEQEGKGVALKQVVAFLNWLHEPEEDDDED